MEVCTRPAIGPDEVLIRVKSTALNAIDHKRMEGMTEFVDKTLPWIPCMDVAGVVEMVGRDCHRLKPGDKVFGKTSFTKQGTLAEFAAVPENHLVLKPEGLTFEEASTFPLSFLTLYQAIVEHAQFQPGQKIFIHGGSGGIGTVGLQIAKKLGARVIATTCSTANVDLVKQLGADLVVDYTKDKWWLSLKDGNFDCMIDCVGGEDVWNECPAVLKPGGKFVTVVGDNQGKLTLGSLAESAGKSLWRKAMSFVGSPSYQLFMARDRLEELVLLQEWLQKGALRPVIDHVYRFESAIDAFNQVMEHHPRGKIVVSVEASSTTAM
jgi:NADPH:quinone reductase-like Zn-dependent oxidoreductase